MGRQARPSVGGEPVSDPQLPVTEFDTKLNPLPPEATKAARAARKARQAFSSAWSTFVRTMRQTMDAYHEARRNGVQRDDAIKGIEFALRDTMPLKVTKFKPDCELCEDTGAVYEVCRPYARCGRNKPSCESKGEQFQHTYVVPCVCQLRSRYIPKAKSELQDDIGKVSKKSDRWSKI